MLASGLSIDQALIAVEAIEDAARASSMTNAERQAKHRAKKRADAEALNNENNVTPVTVVIPVTSVTAAEDPRVCAVFTGEEVRIDTPTEPTVLTPKPEKQTSNRQPRGSRLSPDWEPTEEDRQFARQRLPSGTACREELGKFREHWLAKPGSAALKLDWSLTWRKWVRTAGERYATGPPRAVNGHKPPTNLAINAIREMMEDERDSGFDSQGDQYSS